MAETSVVQEALAECWAIEVSGLAFYEALGERFPEHRHEADVLALVEKTTRELIEAVAQSYELSIDHDAAEQLGVEVDPSRAATGVKPWRTTWHSRLVPCGCSRTLQICFPRTNPLWLRQSSSTSVRRSFGSKAPSQASLTTGPRLKPFQNDTARVTLRNAPDCLRSGAPSHSGGNAGSRDTGLHGQPSRIARRNISERVIGSSTYAETAVMSGRPSARRPVPLVRARPRSSRAPRLRRLVGFQSSEAAQQPGRHPRSGPRW
jgi:hypothetical protein